MYNYSFWDGWVSLFSLCNYLTSFTNEICNNLDLVRKLEEECKINSYLCQEKIPKVTHFFTLISLNLAMIL